MKLKFLILLMALSTVSARDINWKLWNYNSWNYRASIKLIADCNEIEPEIIEAIISWESGWNSQAGKHSKYKGLMQTSGKPRVGFDCTDSTRGYNGKKWIGEVYDPYYWWDNILAGTDKLFRYINIMDGDVMKGITAYNMGPGAAKKWYRKHEGHPYYTNKIMALSIRMKQLKQEGDGMWGDEYREGQ